MDFVVTQEASGREKEPNEAGRKKQDKERLDLLLLRHALAESREKAKALIMAGNVFVDGIQRDKAGAMFPVTAQVELRGALMRYVSRGGLKLEKAVEA